MSRPPGPRRLAHQLLERAAERRFRFVAHGGGDRRHLRNSAAAAAAIRALGDAELDRAAPVSLYSDAPLTCQFFLEDHAVRHSYHHFARVRAALEP